MTRPASKNTLTAIVLLLLSMLMPGQVFAAEKMVGVIMTGNIPYYREVHKAFTQTLASEGFAPGRVTVVMQSPTPEPMSWRNAARKLIAIGSDIIVCYGAPATLTVVGETSDIPVIFAAVFDPAGVGISSARNATGISSKVPVATLIKNLKSISDFSTLGVIYNEAEKDTVVEANEVRQLERTYGFRSVKFNIRRTEDTTKIAQVDALFLTTSCSAMYCVNNIVSIARRGRMATASTIGGGENNGLILTIEANPAEQGAGAAQLVARILRGAKPSSLPVVQPKKVDLILNLKEATSLGLKIPFDLLTAATKVIK
jgi:putative ABC transport system substrate-binding protein